MPIDMRSFDKVEQENRFYPEEVPIFDNEPLKEYFIIVKSPEPINEGVISRVTIKEGELVCNWTGFHLKFQTLHSLQHTEDKVFVHDPFFVGKFLHSCSPNCELNMEEMKIIAIKDINPLDKLTLNYNKTEKKLFQSFTCNCGNDGCLMQVAGYGNN